MSMYILSTILAMVGFVWSNVYSDEPDAMRPPYRSNMTGRGLASTTDHLRRDLPFPDFFVLGAMKCGTTSLVSLILSYLALIVSHVGQRE